MFGENCRFELALQILDVVEVVSLAKVMLAGAWSDQVIWEMSKLGNVKVVKVDGFL